MLRLGTKTENRQSVAGNRHLAGSTAELRNYEANAGYGIVVYAKFLVGCDPEVIPRGSRDRSRRDPEEVARRSRGISGSGRDLVR